jgi:hypothetical protein
VRDPEIVASSGVGWVRINFVIGNRWRSPTDTSLSDEGKTFEQTYRTIIQGFRDQGIKIYALVGHEAVASGLHNALRDDPGGARRHDWIDEYVRNFTDVVRMFRNEVEVFESFNEPDNWEGGIPLPFLLAFAQSQPAGAMNGTASVSVAPAPAPVTSGSTSPAPAAAVAIPTDASWAARKAGEFWNRYGGYIASESQRLGIDPADAMGVIVAESGGDPFGPDGRMTIRFENHIFNSYWGKLNPQRFGEHFTFDAKERWKGHTWRPSTSVAWQPCHGSQAVEWQVLDFARTLDNEAALKSISMGAGQVMGFNHETVGYASAQAMFDAFSKDATAQLGAMFRFMEKNRLVESIRNQDYIAFARLYNGPGQAGEYATRMTDFANAFRALGGAAAGRDAQSVTAAPPAVSAPENAAPRAPQPDAVPGVPLKEADPELYAAWSKHIQSGFAQNEIMFGRVLNAFMNPYWMTVVMYAILFAIGVATAIATIVLSLRPGADTTATVIVAGMSIAAFLAFFIRRPLQSLEENLQFITWLGIVYNTYWTTLVNAQDRTTFVADLERATETAISRIKELSKAHAARSRERPKLEE